MKNLTAILLVVLTATLAPFSASAWATDAGSTDGSQGATQDAATQDANSQSVELSGVSNKVLKDCLDGVINGKYSQKELKNALNQVPDDVAQYTGCVDAIENSQYKSLQHGKGSKDLNITKNGSVAPTNSEFKDLKKAESSGGSPLTLGGVPIVPGSTGDAAVFSHDLLSSMPLPVVVLMFAVALSLVGLAVASGYRRGYFDKILKIFGR